MHDDQRYFYDALKAGAAGYVLKHSADTQLVEAIRAAIRGEPFMSPVAEEELLRNWLDEGATGSDLTPRELEVVKLIAEAHTEQADRADPEPVGEDGRVASRERAREAGDEGPRRARALCDPQGPDRALNAASGGDMETAAG